MVLDAAAEEVEVDLVEVVVVVAVVVAVVVEVVVLFKW